MPNTPRDRDLPIPPSIDADDKAMEILRAWTAERGLIVAVRPTMWQDPAAWGIVLADAARHIANAIQAQRNAPAAKTVAQIREMFDRELDSPTSANKGGFVT